MNRAVFFSLILIFLHPVLFSQDLKNKNYSELFNESKLLIANQKQEAAIPILEEMYARDKSNSNAAYLLALCYVKSFKNINKAISLLEAAKGDYSKFYDRSSVKERGVSEYAYYYLIIAYSLKGDCKNTISTLNGFYKVYSYEDEWYLIDGQKWYRQCGKHKWKDEDSIKIANVPIDSTNAVLDSNSGSNKLVTEDTNPAQRQENITNSVQIISPPNSMSPGTTSPYRDRLRRVGEVGGPEIMTRGVSHNARTSLYGVQVGAYIKPRFAKDFKDLKNVEVYIDNNGVFRYVIGRFVYRTQADKLLNYVQEVGYQDAFIVDVNTTKNFNEEVVRVNNQSIKREITGVVEYRVQIGAFKEEDIPEDVMRIYLQFDDINENTQKDLTILTLGEYGDYEIAKAFCSNIQELGIPDAFVVAFNQGRKITIEEARDYLIRKREEEIEKAREETAIEQKEKKKKKK
ncbi:MAG: tetratricopeptide repeat protein [Salibacteraceae bacterium]|nr:tetratricopeptide repeat protein [Salibacteraceae bacterium]|tara:strand:- start:17135 stop:18511 length:1377 start_codon:yes stop_codon:yes gene_type:complete